MGYALDRCRPPSRALPCPSLLLQPPFSPRCLEGPSSELLGRSLRRIRGRSFPDVSGVVQARLPKGNCCSHRVAGRLLLCVWASLVFGPLPASSLGFWSFSLCLWRRPPPSPLLSQHLTLALCARPALALASMLAPGLAHPEPVLGAAQVLLLHTAGRCLLPSARLLLLSSVPTSPSLVLKGSA